MGRPAPDVLLAATVYRSIRHPVLASLSPTTGIRSIPTNACTVSSDRRLRSVAPSTARRTIRTAATAAVSCSFPALPPEKRRLRRCIGAVNQGFPKFR
jgi:hypothetical protein